MSQDASSVTPALLPCPLCAGEARVAKPYGIEAVICRDCHLTITDHDQQSAVAKWNRRPASQCRPFQPLNSRAIVDCSTCGGQHPGLLGMPCPDTLPVAQDGAA